MERAFDMAQEVEALFTNFDASVYTIIFIPADAAGVLPPGAEKYLKQVMVLPRGTAVVGSDMPWSRY